MEKSVVITGCGTGIGRAIFDRLIGSGWMVVGVDMNADLAADARAAAGGRGEVIVGDVAVTQTLETAADRAQALAPLRGWVNNAALAIPGNLHEPDRVGVERVISVNLMGYFWGASIAIRRFLAQRMGGAIVNISSIHGSHSFAGWAAYDVAKGGVDALTRYICVEYGPVGIRANAIAPGAIMTPLFEKVVADSPDPAATAESFAVLHPLERPGQPHEVAAVAAFLLSDDASFLSGEVIAVDGGAISRCFRFPPDAAFVNRFKPGR